MIKKALAKFWKKSGLEAKKSRYFYYLYPTSWARNTASFCKDPNLVPNSWQQYFEGIDDGKQSQKEKTRVSWEPKKIKPSSEIDPDIYEKFIPEKLNQVLNEKIKNFNFILIDLTK